MKKLLSQIVTVGIAAAILFLYAPAASAQEAVIVSVSGDLTGAVGTRGAWFTPELSYSKLTVSGEVRSRATLSGCANYDYKFSKRIAAYIAPNDSITWRLTVTIGAAVVFDQTYTNLDESTFTGIVIPLGAMAAGEVEVVQRVEGYGNGTASNSAMYGESGYFYCTCAPVPVAGTLTANPPSGIPGTQVSVTGAMWDNGRTSAEYRLFFDGKLVAVQGDLICYTQPNMIFDIPCDTPPGPHTITNQLVDSATQQVLAFRDVPFQVNEPAFATIAGGRFFASSPCAPPPCTIAVRFIGDRSPANRVTFGPEFPDETLGLKDYTRLMLDIRNNRRGWFYQVEIIGTVPDDASQWALHQSFTGRVKFVLQRKDNSLDPEETQALNEPSPQEDPDRNVRQQDKGQKKFFWLDVPGFFATVSGKKVHSVTQVQNFISWAERDGKMCSVKWHFKLVVKPGGIMDKEKSEAGLGHIPDNDF
jgi:hypothetical protein